IDFDRTTFSFLGNNGFSTFDISPESVSITPIVDGIDLSFENQMSVSDYALGESDSQEAVEATFNAGFSFLPNGGRTITGYQVTLYGDYDTERPGDATAAVFGVGTLFFSSGSN